MKPIIVNKHTSSFKVCGEYSCKWFDSHMNKGNWERRTFDIIDFFSNKKRTTKITLYSGSDLPDDTIDTKWWQV